MGNPLTSSAFVRLLDGKLKKVFTDEYAPLPSMIEQLYNVMTSESAFEEFFSIGAVPDIPEFNGKVTYLPVAPGYYTKIEPKEYAGGIQYERKLLDDEKYGVFKNRTEGLARATQRTREKIGVRPFAFAFSSAYDYMVSEEGVALCSTAHTTKAGTSTASGFSNAGTSAMSKTSVAATRLLMRRFRNDISERIEISDDLAIVCPDNLADMAMEINMTPKGLDTAEGNINPQYKRYTVIPYKRLDDFSTTDWFMVDRQAMKQKLAWLDRIKPDVNNTVDFDSFIVKSSVYFRLAYGWLDWRWIYGMNVA